MGNYRFRLSDMIPNAWFYKLRDMSKTKSRGHSHTISSSSSLSYSSSNLQLDKKRQPHHLSYQRKSYYISRNLSPTGFSPTDHNNNDNQETFSNNPKFPDNIHFSEPPRKSSKKRHSTTKRRTVTSPKLVTSSVSGSCSCRASLESVWTKPDSTPEEYPNSPNSSSSSSSKQESSLPQFQETLDPIISLSPSCGCSVTAVEARPGPLRPGEPRHQKGRYDHCTNDTKEPVTKIELPPIITKPGKFKETEEKQRISTTMRRVSVSSTTGLKLRTNSPRITNNKRIQGSRKSVSSRRTSSVSESFAVVKSSHNPQKDFRESMVEMILENNIRASKELEELLAAYLSLNSDEYHDLIIKVFKQIWFDITDNRIK